MTDRLDLLRAILAVPNDDTPRLVYADWLDEHGATDADAARAEFIRLGCGKGGRRTIRPPEKAWLATNWQRLLPATLALVSPPRWPYAVLEGRFLFLTAHWDWEDDGRRGWGRLVLEFGRGFVARVGFKDRPGYDRLRAAVAADEPVAAHGPEDLPRAAERGMGFKAVVVPPDDWGADVFDRIGGFDAELLGRYKRYVTRPHDTKAPAAEWDPQHRARAALTAAMTALAREWNGLAPPAVGG